MSDRLAGHSALQMLLAELTSGINNALLKHDLVYCWLCNEAYHDTGQGDHTHTTEGLARLSEFQRHVMEDRAS